MACWELAAEGLEGECETESRDIFETLRCKGERRHVTAADRNVE